MNCLHVSLSWTFEKYNTFNVYEKTIIKTLLKHIKCKHIIYVLLFHVCLNIQRLFLRTRQQISLSLCQRLMPYSGFPVLWWQSLEFRHGRLLPHITLGAIGGDSQLLMVRPVVTSSYTWCDWRWLAVTLGATIGDLQLHLVRLAVTRSYTWCDWRWLAVTLDATDGD